MPFEKSRLHGLVHDVFVVYGAAHAALPELPELPLLVLLEVGAFPPFAAQACPFAHWVASPHVPSLLHEQPLIFVPSAHAHTKASQASHGASHLAPAAGLPELLVPAPVPVFVLLHATVTATAARKRVDAIRPKNMVSSENDR